MCFNPTMVRLLLLALLWRYVGAMLFQSHNGAIAARATKNVRSVIMFQSHNGAIAADRVPLDALYFGLVSIPQWCDCCSEPCKVLSRKVIVSIPQWCDCCHRHYVHYICRCPSFNPTMVRLLPCWNKTQIELHRVSIPQWCDCC